MFYDLFKSLCDAKGVSPSRAAVDSGINKSNVTYWKNNETAKPTGQIAKRLCNYFGVTMSELYGETQIKKAPAKQEPDDDDIKFALFGGSGEITDEMYEEVKAFAKFVQQREKEKKK